MMGKLVRLLSAAVSVFVGFSVMSLLAATAQAAPAPYAETVILNGKVITADSDDPEDITIAEAIAIYGDRIMAVGSNEDIRKLIADWTEVIDAKGNSVIPGLIDTHNHIYETSTGFPWVVRSLPELLEIDVRANTEQELADILHKAVAARANQVDDGTWIRIRLNPAEVAVKTFGDEVTRSSLDEVGPDNPVFVSTRGGSVLNTNAIEAVEGHYGNELPAGYWMNGKDIGWSGEYTDFSRCIGLDLISGKPEVFDTYIKGYFEVMQANAQIGVTTHKSHLQCESGFSASSHLARNGLMPIRLAWGHRWMQPFSPYIKETYRRIGDWTGYGSDFMWSIGSSVGGIDAGGVGWCTSMPADDNIKGREQCPPAPEGLEIDAIQPINTVQNRARRTEHLETLAALAAEGRISGIPGWHVSGDGALDLLFKTYQASGMSDEKIRTLRIESDHCHAVTQEQVQLAARLNHTFSCDAADTPTRVIKAGYGEEYLTLNAPVNSMLKAGARVVISEFGIQGELRTSPFEDGVMWLTRKINGETWGVPEEAVPDRMTLMLMMTRWGAYPLWRENTIGSIEVGKLADIVILNGDYMAGPVEDLDKLTSILTLIGGQVAHETSELRGNTLNFSTDTAEWTLEQNTPTTLWRWDEAPEIPAFLTGAAGH
ncbi:amidohydrolase family protein [Gammaproteobacteria bacterium]|jgi:predicted amidohydrolase YtcJ|nr:amidohydrolase family protein [Gammaproteobacteria bacterium]